MQLQLIIPENKKTCQKCGASLPITEFYVDRGKKDGRYAWCKACHRAKYREYQATDEGKAAIRAARDRFQRRQIGEDVPKLKADAGNGKIYNANPRSEYRRRKRGRRRISVRRFIVAVKVDSGCAICGETMPDVLDFHHLDPKSKRFIISRSAGSLRQTITTTANEMRKCVLLCANCHRKVHAGVLAVDSSMVVSELAILRAREAARNGSVH